MNDTVRIVDDSEIAKLKQRLEEMDTTRKSLEKELVLSRTANKFLSQVLDAVDALVVVVDSFGKIVRLNNAFAQTIGDSGQRIDGKPLWDMFLLPDDIASVRSTMQKLFSGQCRTIHENYWLTKNGNLRLINWSFKILRDGPGAEEYAVGVGADITEREQAEEDLRINKERYQLLFNSVNDAVFVYSVAKPNKRNKIIEVNEIACKRLGYSREELLKLSGNDIEIPVNSTQTQLIAHKLQMQGHALFEAVQIAKDGHRIPVEVNAHLFSLYGETAVLSVARDITERKIMEEKLQYITMHDSLTGLYNRNYYEEEISRLERSRDSKACFIMCDVDGLKFVNDTMGHHAGDVLLKKAAAALANSIREGDFAARIGGDEFVVILYNINHREIEAVCERIKHNIENQNLVQPSPVLSISVGWAVSGGKDIEIQQTIREADNNMYREKLARKNNSSLLQLNKGAALKGKR